ncbi:MAG: DUF4830 domain-containing protein [Clostridia bacterium]|nr:DUF4830 domain-containing protein [Clostridia bacterium]
MFLSLKIGKKTIIALIVGIIVAVLLIVGDIIHRTDEANALAEGSTAQDRIVFLNGYGWKLGEETESIQVVIPSVFNDVYKKYNDIQISEGYDLTPYMGKICTRYTYEVLNYPDGIDGVYANLLVYEGKIIGGDICTYAIDGFMHGFSGDAETTGVMFGSDALEN